MAKRARGSMDETPGLFDQAPEPEVQPAPTEARDRSAAKAAPQKAKKAKEERPTKAEPPIFTVGRLTAEVQDRLGGLGRVRVEGELSGAKRAASGHVYFDLKDEGARISCVVWRSAVARALRFEPEDGAQVVATGYLDVYAPRGSYSLIVERLEPVGVGALLARLEKLKRELAERGWFERRRALPRLPQKIGVVTSKSGAALRDFLQTRSQRWPDYPLRICHTPVQGPDAAPEIAAAIRALDRSGVSVLVVCRGGGSLEDLWAFNERPVAEAIWSASVPVVSGVGHESDTTLADFVADHRAHTPTDAAQLVIPDRGALYSEVERVGNYLGAALERLVQVRSDRLQALAGRPVLRDARWILTEREERLGSLGIRLRQEVRARGQAGEVRLRDLSTRLERQSPHARLARWERRMAEASVRLQHGATQAVEQASGRLSVLSRALETISPLRVLARGYSVTTAGAEQAPLVDAGQVKVGDELHTRLHRGRLMARVERVEALDADEQSSDAEGEA